MRKFCIFLFVFIFIRGIVFAHPSTERSNSGKTITFTDSCGRTVELPANLTKVAPSGSVATMMFASIAPEYMCNVNSTPTQKQMEYLPRQLADLPATGQLYGSKASLNYEELIATGAQVLIDLGDYKSGIEKDLDALQTQIGIPCIFIQADLQHMAQAFRTLGHILSGKEKRGEEIAGLIDRTLKMAEENRSKIKESEKVSVMYSSSKDGLGTDARTSSQAQVIEIVGAENAVVVEKATSKGGGNIISLEQVYNFDPDVIIFSPTSIPSIYKTVGSDPAWKNLRAVKTGKYYEIPGEPYNWMSNPPSLNMILGIWWLGNLLYPQYYDYNMVEVVQKIFRILWNYNLTEEQAKTFLNENAK